MVFRQYGKDLTRINHDDADLFRGHLTITAPAAVVSLVLTTQPRRAWRKGASMPAESIRFIVVIVVHPCQVFGCLAE